MIITKDAIKRILKIKPPSWRYCFNFKTWFESLSTDVEVNYVEFSNCILFVVSNGDIDTACLVYDPEKIHLGVKWSNKIIFTLYNSYEIPGFNKEEFFQLGKRSTITQGADFKLRQDSPDGWLDLVINDAPSLYFPHALSLHEEAFQNGNYYCERDELGIRNLVLWEYLSTGAYFGRLLWSRDRDLSIINIIANIHARELYLGNTGFVANCAKNNVTALKLHTMLGYKFHSSFYEYKSF
jgi:hypothetical protein